MALAGYLIWRITRQYELDEVLAAIGAWRLLKPIASRRGRLTGLVIYLVYGYRRSRLGRGEPAPESEPKATHGCTSATFITP